MAKMKDFFGRELVPGDKVMYCTRRGSSLDLIYAEVLASGEKIRVAVIAGGYGQKQLYDTRTGKKIDRYAEKHTLIDSHVFSSSSPCPPGCTDEKQPLIRGGVEYGAWHPRTYQPWVAEQPRQATLGMSCYVVRLEAPDDGA